MVARRIGAVLLALVLGGGLAACGDDGGDDGDAVDQVDRDGGGDDSSDDGGGGNDDSDGGGDFPDAVFGSEECAELIQAFGAFGAVFSGTGDFDFEQMADGFEGVADEAPEVADDLEVMAEAYREFGEAVRGQDLSDPSVFQSGEVLAAAEAFSSDEFSEAADNVSAFMQDVCTVGG